MKALRSVRVDTVLIGQRGNILSISQRISLLVHFTPSAFSLALMQREGHAKKWIEGAAVS